MPERLPRAMTSATRVPTGRSIPELEAADAGAVVDVPCEGLRDRHGMRRVLGANDAERGARLRTLSRHLVTARVLRAELPPGIGGRAARDATAPDSRPARPPSSPRLAEPRETLRERLRGEADGALCRRLGPHGVGPSRVAPELRAWGLLRPDAATRAAR